MLIYIYIYLVILCVYKYIHSNFMCVYLCIYMVKKILSFESTL